MKKALWMIGLSIALLVNGGFVVVCLIGLAKRGHLNSRGWLMLVGSGCISWLVLQQLLTGARQLLQTEQIEEKKVELPYLTKSGALASESKDELSCKHEGSVEQE